MGGYKKVSYLNDERCPPVPASEQQSHRNGDVYARAEQGFTKRIDRAGLKFTI